MPIATIGMSRTTIDPHQKWSRGRPPTIGPSGSPAAPAVATAVRRGRAA
ncbi:hypothetical protein [Streptomyces panacea]